MVILHIEALAAIVLCLSVLMAGAWLVQQRSGNSGWVDTIWTRGARYRAYQLRTSMFFPLPPKQGVAA